MNHHFSRMIAGLGVLAMVIPACAGSTAAPADRVFMYPVVSPTHLAQIRGGFELPELNLRLSFGLERAVFINGELVARTALKVDALQDRLAARLASTSDTVARVEAEVQARVTAQLTRAGLTGLVVLPESGLSQQANTVAASTTGDEQMAGGSALADTATPPVAVTLVQQADLGQVASPVKIVASQTAINTVIQNSLDHQQIQTLTLIDASANSLQLLRAMNLREAIRESVIQGLRR